MSQKQKDYLIINRAKWRTGQDGETETGKGDTQLLNKEGYMCCLGFRCQQMGVPRKLLLEEGTPGCIRGWDIPDLIDDDGDNTEFSQTAMELNDAQDMSRITRERKIKAHFETIGVTVEFIGDYKK
jgi:hypothetical protein